MPWQTQSVVQLFAGNTIINPQGTFVYSGPPAAGNLIFSITPPGTTTDNFGNIVISGAGTSYSSGFAAALSAGSILFYTGSLAGGWTFRAEIETDVSGDLLLVPTGAGIVSVTSNMTVSGTLSVNGSINTAVPVPNATSSNGLPDGTIHGTSGPASAGTAHTHSPGSFAVGNGQHSHDTQNHLHAL